MMLRNAGSFLFSLALAICVCSTLAPQAFATNFAVLLSGCGNGGDNDKCNSDDDRLQVSNPLYKPSGNKGENPLFEAKTDLLIFSPTQIASGQDVEMRYAFGDSISIDVPPVPGESLVFELDIVDVATGQKITNFP